MQRTASLTSRHHGGGDQRLSSLRVRPSGQAGEPGNHRMTAALARHGVVLSMQFETDDGVLAPSSTWVVSAVA